MRRGLVGLLVAALTAGCTGGGPDRAAGPLSIAATPATAPMDVPVAVTVSGLRPGEAVTLGASATDRNGVRWSSRAEFVAGPDGTVSADRAPTGGSWSGPHPMGLFTTMTPDRPAGGTVFVVPGGYPVTLTASAAGRQPAATTVRRQAAADVGVRTRVLRPATDGVYGTLFLPPDTARRRPAVLVFGGSEGGQGMDYPGSLLAAHGHPVLSLAYFAAPGLPRTLERVPIDYFARAAALLRRQPGVDPRQVFAWGVSRGGEAALLLGVHFPEAVAGVVAAVTSDHVLSALPEETRPAWTVRGRPLPFGTPGDFATPGAPGAPESVIPVERIAGPVVTVCGIEDLLIPSCPFARAIAARRGAAGGRRGDLHLEYARAGHAVGVLSPYNSTTTTAATSASGRTIELGGSPVDTAEAGGAARARLLAFLASR